MSDFYNDGSDWEKLFKEWASEAEDYAKKKVKFDRFLQKLEEEKVPYRKREQALRAEKKERGESEELSGDERCRIWRGFNEIQRRIIDEIYGQE
jgi:hypothetical protein